jgi:hypothetical protein
MHRKNKIKMKAQMFVRAAMSSAQIESAGIYQLSCVFALNWKPRPITHKLQSFLL